MAPGARREAILDAAHGLFTAHGWEAVTVANVLEAAGLSKGGFYHHFSSKEDLLSGLIARFAEHAIRAAQATPSSGDALARLNGFLIGSARWTADNSDDLRGIVEIVSRPGNEILLRRICDAEEMIVLPVLVQIIREGASEGTFDTVDAEITAKIMLRLAQERRESLVEVLCLTRKGNIAAAMDRLVARMQSEGRIFDRLLGLPQGSVAMSNPLECRRMLSGLRGSGLKGDGLVEPSGKEIQPFGEAS